MRGVSSPSSSAVTDDLLKTRTISGTASASDAGPPHLGDNTIEITMAAEDLVTIVLAALLARGARRPRPVGDIEYGI
jgi:hypothetical protein